MYYFASESGILLTNHARNPAILDNGDKSLKAAGLKFIGMGVSSGAGRCDFLGVS